ncbi:MAG: hypothetical protein WBD27_10840 [Pyrinomonadaceae bacterium]
MQVITNSVGENGNNNISDVALVQAILVKTLRPATATTPSAPFLASYDGVSGNSTIGAIRDFQNNHVFVSANGQQSAPNPNATAGLVRPNDATWAKLVEMVPADFSDMRVLAGGKTVYVAATAAQLQVKIAAANALIFTQAFRTKVIACINRMHSLHGIAIGVCSQGDRRNFQTQYDLLTSGRNVTNAGPGESNHNFGMAVDLGFAGLRWLQSNGTVTERETSWLHSLEAVNSAQALKFWEALRTVGTSAEVGAFRGPESDRPHLQNWEDAGVSMAARLADLLTRSGTMRWSGRRGAYSCDLGFGGELFAVGTAAQVWNRQATITVANLVAARAGQVALAAPGGPPRQVPGIQRPGAPNQQPNRPQGPPTQVDVVAMQQELRRQFELADANWQNWTPR